MKKRLAYLMHVDWNWIKQRPHFIAEQLSKEHNVELTYIRNYRNHHTVRNILEEGFQSIRQLTKVPFSSRRKTLRIFERAINSGVLRTLYTEQYDYIWITSPIVLQYVSIERLSHSIIIYDCMDDILAFPQSRQSESYVKELEKKLLVSANVVITSSTVLRNKMIDRGAKSEVYVVNNAVSSAMLPTDKTVSIDLGRCKRNNDLLSIVYFGTVAEWLDFCLIIELLEMHADIEITLIGPIQAPIPFHPRLKAIGPVAHARLKEYADAADAFVMPFVVNELIESVDPVKVYEYIALQKPSLIVRYSETVKFGEYVHLYNGLEELSKWVSYIKKGDSIKAAPSEIIKFLQRNTWEQRASEISRILKNHESLK